MNYKRYSKILIALLIVAVLPIGKGASAISIGADNADTTENIDSVAFTSRFKTTHDRPWPGGAYWANPLEDWRINSGRLETVRSGSDRNLHLLTHVLGTARGSFTTSVQVGAIEIGTQGSVGFRIGIREPEINDHRSNVFYGKGLNTGLTVDGHLILAGQQKKLQEVPSFDDIKLHLSGKPAMHNYELVLTATDLETGRKLGEIKVDGIEGDQVVGNIALVNNHRGEGSRFWFQDWKVSGSKIESYPVRRFGPILWSMYSLNDTRSDEGYVLKMSAQFPPLGERDADVVSFQIKRGYGWETVEQARIDSQSRNAIFRIPNWQAGRDTRYRLLYRTEDKQGNQLEDEWKGIIKKDPKNGGDLSIASLNCQHDAGFPYKPIVDNIAKINPDMLTFHGDQLYESNGGYGVIRDVQKEGIARATLNYLRKFYMFGWAFREIMRNRPTILMPDDHDVFQGNIWGEGGAAPDGINASTTAGYLMPPDWVNMVHRTQTGHNPDPYDPRPIKRGITPWYGDMVYGGVSFAIVSERMFKSGPGHVDTGEGRADLIETPDYDTLALDKPGLTLLGDRQLEFLKQWITDWNGAEMKVVLGQTPYANLNTHSGPNGNRLYADLDTNGWPQTPRNNALRILRKGFAFHLNGDQHLPTVTHYGIDGPRDANWGFCPPGISVGWPRWWMADQVGIEVENSPPHGLPNTGQYTGPFGHPSYLYAVGNPIARDGVNRYVRAHNKASGFGVLRVNTRQRTIQMEAYRFLAEIGNKAVDNQFPGWPVTIGQLDNYGKKRAGYLPEVSHPGTSRPIVKVYRDKTDKLLYALRSPSHSFRPFVFEEGTYRVEVGDPETDSWKTYEKQQVHESQ